MVVLFLMAFGWNVALAEEYQPGAYRAPVDPEKNSGDISSAEICPKGQYVVGFTGRTGAWIDRIGLLCAVPLPSEAMGKAQGTPGHGMGGGGGGGAEVKVTSYSFCKTGPLLAIKFWAVNDYRMIARVYGKCRGGDTVTFSGETMFNPDTNIDHICPNGMAATGLQARFGKDVNAIGLICDKFELPNVASAPPPRGPSRMLFCQGGGMTVGSGPLKLSIIIGFKAAPQSSRAAIPARGECAWQDTPVAANEPKRIYVPIKDEMKPLVDAAQNGGIFLIHGAVQGDAIQIDKIDSVNVGFVPGAGRRQ
ncbi:MAG: hypothetical protein GY844_28160 [Bradyrhizobium sp.]|nr:hypothetical protein [Bradyrhizobium sp.]